MFLLISVVFFIFVVICFFSVFVKLQIFVSRAARHRAENAAAAAMAAATAICHFNFAQACSCDQHLRFGISDLILCQIDY